MAQSRRFVRFFISFSLALIPLGAQPQKAEKTAGAKVSAVWLNGQAGPRDVYVAAGQGTPVVLPVGASGRGKAVTLQVSGAATLRLFSRQAPTAPGGPDTFAGVGEIALPAGSADRFLLVLASQVTGLAVKGVAIADDLKSFPVASLRVANFTGSSLSMRLDTQVKTLASGVSDPFAYSVVADPKQKVVPSFPFALAKGEKVFFNGRIDAWPGSRTLILLIPGLDADKAPAVQSLIDTPPVVPATVTK